MATEYSKVGHTEKMFGQNFSIVTTNAAGSDMLNFEQTDNQSFINSSLIIASPGNDDGVDYGTPSLLVTDYEGHPMRLTYTIKPGNGLVLGYTYSTINGIKQSDSLDTLSFAIDNDSIKVATQQDGGFVYVSGKGIIEGSYYLRASNENDIDVNIGNLIDNNRLMVYPGLDHVRIGLDAEKIIDKKTLKVNVDSVSDRLYGFANQQISVDLPNIIDETSIKLGNNTVKGNYLYVDTSSLDSATTSRAGVVKIDGNTIRTNKNGQIMVMTGLLNTVGPKGGKGIIGVHAQGSGEIWADNAGVLHLDPTKMSKCSPITSGVNKGYGVCTVDGKTITASTDGVLSVISDGIKPATSSENGVVRPDNHTIKINAGEISVNTQNLTKADAAQFGIVKIDNKTIKKNSDNALYIVDADKWTSTIQDIQTTISGYSQQIANLKTQLTDFMATITNKTSTPFKAIINSNVDLKTIAVHIPNTSGRTTSTTDWNLYTLNKTFTINYGAGYIFRYNISSVNSSSWLVSSRLYVNNVAYAPGADIKLTNNSATAWFLFTVQGYGTSTIERPEGVFNITFSDGNGQPIKIMTLYLHHCYTVKSSSGFKCIMNGSPYSSGNTSFATNNATLDDMINSIQSNNSSLPNINTGVVRSGGSVSTSCNYKR